MLKCVCSEHLKHFFIFEQLYETQIRCAHSVSSDACIFSSQNRLAFITVFDWNRLPTAELERHDLQNGRDNSKTCTAFMEFVHAISYAYEIASTVPCANSYGLLQLDNVMS